MLKKTVMAGSPNNSDFKFGERSESFLVDVHPDLVALARLAIKLSHLDFGIHCGKRTVVEQRLLVKKGASMTMNSRHVVTPVRAGGNGWCHAIDVHPYIDGDVRWDMPYFNVLDQAFQHAGLQINIPYEWGGDWKSFPDGPHFQLPWNEYPKDKRYEAVPELEPLIDPNPV